MANNTIPVVDLQEFVNGTEEEQNQFVNKLAKAFHEIGFVWHVSAVERFRGKTFTQARRMLKKWWTHREQDEIIHFLKTQNFLVGQSGHWLTDAIKKENNS